MAAYVERAWDCPAWRANGGRRSCTGPPHSHGSFRARLAGPPTGMLVGGRPARRPPWTDPAAGRGCASLSNKHSALGSSVGRGIRAFLGHEQLRLSRLPQQRDPRPARHGRSADPPPGPAAERLRRRLPLGFCFFVRVLQDRSPFSAWGTCSESRLCGRLPWVSVRVAGALSPPPSAGPTPAVAPDSPGGGCEMHPWQNGP